MSFFGVKYEYSPIDTNSRTFRLIKILPPKRSWLRQVLHVQILEADLDASPIYDALSYSWNVAPDKKPERNIIVDTPDGSRELLVHPPLEMALFELSKSPLPIFVDSICINQDVIAEKAHQVSLMCDIYAKCQTTVVWLGANTRTSDEYIDYVTKVLANGALEQVMSLAVPRFMQVFDAVMDSDEILSDEILCQHRDGVLQLLSMYGDGFPLEALHDVLKRKWFSRLWIIQEACLAPKVVFVCGSKSLTFDEMRAGVLFFNVYNTHWVRHLDHVVSRRELDLRNTLLGRTGALRRIFQERKAIHYFSRREAIYNVVLRYNVNHREEKIGATLVEDRVFALIGLASDAHGDDRIMPEYGNTVQVLSDIAAMLARRNLDVLLYNQLPKKTRDLPTWVPDWATSLQHPAGYTQLDDPAYDAGGPSSAAELMYDREARALTVQGYVVGKIARLGTHHYEEQQERLVNEQLDYITAINFFQEAREFVGRARGIPGSQYEHLSSEQLTDIVASRLIDGGLTYRYLLKKMEPEPAMDRIRQLYGFSWRVGTLQARAVDTVQSFHITRILHTIGIAPWYWVPGSEVDTLHRCAVDPLSAAKGFVAGVGEAMYDLVSVCLASSAVLLYPHYLRIRRMAARNVNMTSQARQTALEPMGLDVDISSSADLNDMTVFILKHVGRLLYMTDMGHVGMCPRHSEVGDCVVVLRGSTTAHVLRPYRGRWLYIGEAFCDGVMNGEMLDGQAQSFTLV